MTPMEIALAEARAAAVRGEVPVGAVVLDGAGAVLARAGNEVEARHDASAHAELLALRAAAALRGEARLPDCELVVTLDCGAAAYDAIAAAAEIGLDVVVIDHHLMREVPPAAAALVNPNRADCVSGQGVLAAAGVTFVLLAALNREARRRGLFAGMAEPDLRQWLDLAALGALVAINYASNDQAAQETLAAIEAKGGQASLIKKAQGSFESAEELRCHLKIDVEVA